MEELRHTSEYNKIHFAVMAIEAAAKQLKVSPQEMQQRLVRVNLLQRLILDYYDVMHTQSLKHVAEDVVMALLAWENKLQETQQKGEIA